MTGFITQFWVLATLLVFELSIVELVVSNDSENQGHIEEFMRSLNASYKAKLESEGTCVDLSSNTELGDYCTFEIVDRDKEVFSLEPSSLELCIKFGGFTSDATNCKKIFCFDLKHSVTFWVLVIGGPIAIIIAIATLIWMCCHFAYYMFCCCIFHKPIPAIFDHGHAGATRVAPEKAPSKAAPSPEEDKQSKSEAASSETKKEEKKDEMNVEKKEEMKAEKKEEMKAEKKEEMKVEKKDTDNQKDESKKKPSLQSPEIPSSKV